MGNRIFGAVAVVVGFVMIGLAEGNVYALLGAMVVISMGLGFLVYGNGR